MVTAGSLFSTTLQGITNTKLEELAKKRQSFEDGKSSILGRLQNEHDSVIRLTMLADGVKSCFDVSLSGGKVVRGSTNNPRLEIELMNLDRFLQQARYDPSISAKVVDQWQKSLLRHLDIQSLKFTFASLYGRLTTEWLQSKQLPTSRPVPDPNTDDFEHVSHDKKLEGRSKWEQIAFEPAKTNEAAVTRLLEETFDTSSEYSKPLKSAMEDLRKNVETFEHGLASPDNFNTSTLGWTISGLIDSDLLTDEKRAVLKDFATNSVIINEIADVLNMRMAALGSWSWGDEVLLEQRRQLSGAYNIYMHEDLLQAIFLQYIGVKWSVFWKRAFSDIRRTKGVWKSTRTSITSIDHKRREFYLGPSGSRPSVQSAREKLYRQLYFVSRLMKSETQHFHTEEGDEEAEISMQPYALMQQAMPQRTAQTPRVTGFRATKRHRKILPQSVLDANPDDLESEDDDSDEPKNPMEAKQRLLHLLSAEIMIKTRIRGEICCFRSQFDNFYPSLPHSTIESTLKFFGVGEKWLSFFKRFLQAPLRFMDDNVPARIRSQGTPGSHVLSEVFGEVVLFCLDFKVNQSTEGELLWRLHDDFWFWSSDYDRCVKTWSTINSFANIMGLSLNQARTGSARMLQKLQNGVRSMASIPVDPPLPRGQIRWGMLCLNPESGRFEIDQEMVKNHIHELDRQLQDNLKSVFAWIQAWNSYAATFFTSNFGKPANCFGRQHVDNMFATHKLIQEGIFRSSTPNTEVEAGNVATFLRQTIELRFGIKDVPDGYFFFPIELGGLEVKSPFITLSQVRDSVLEHPENLLDSFEEAEREEYRSAKLDYEDGLMEAQQTYAQDPNFKPKDPTIFMPFGEYIKYREELGYGYTNELVHVFNELLKQPGEQSIDFDESGPIKLALNSLGSQSNLRGITGDWYSMEPYWKWVAQLYGQDIIDHFDGLNIVDAGLLPIGMVSLFRSGRVKWQD